MARITITDWEEGLNKVQLNHLLRQHAGYGLAEAKHAVDGLLKGKHIMFESHDLESASTFCRLARSVGAVCSTTDEAHGECPTLNQDRPAPDARPRHRLFKG